MDANAKVLVCCIVGPGKEYTRPFLTPVLQGLGAAGYYTVLDGAGWMPQGLPGDVEQLSDDVWQANDPGLYGRQARMRNAGRARCLAGDWTHLYFHDADTIPPCPPQAGGTSPAGVIGALLAHDVPIATALYNGRQFDTPLIPMEPQTPILDTRPLLVDGFGMGAMLIRRDVVQAIEFQSGEPGEDIGFGRAAAAHGWRTLVDTALPCWHVRADGTANRVTVQAETPGVVWTDLPHFVANRFGAWERNVPRHDLTPEQIALLGPGFVHNDYARLTVEIKPLAFLLSAEGLR
jgi:hypothetical protein